MNPLLRPLRLAFCLLAALGCAGPAFAQCVSLTTPGSAYTQSFDTLSNTAASTTNNLTITGWFLTESGLGIRDNEQYGVDTGASTTGDTYSYGAAAATDRALGSLRSGTLIPLYGACFTNNTGATITSLDVAYTGEEWRLGTAARTDQIDFQYSLNATSLDVGTWIDVNALDFVTPVTATAGAKDGNAAANRTALSSSIPSLTIANGATFWIRWNDADASGADDGLAVDGFSLTPQAPPPPTRVTFNPTSGSTTETDADFTYNLPIALANPSATAATSVTVALTGGTGSAADVGGYTTTTLSVPANTSTFNFPITITGDNAVEPDETLQFQITSVSGGNAAAIGTNSTYTLTIVNDDAAPVVSFDPVEGSVAETDADGTFDLPIAIANPSNVPFDVQVIVIGGTGSADDIGEIASASGTVPAGATTFTIEIPITGDDVPEPDETIVLQIGAVDGGTSGTADTFTLTITDDDVATVVSFAIPSGIAGEGDADTTYDLPLTIENPGAAPVDVTVALTGGTGSPADVGGFTPITFTVPANTATETLLLTITGDDLPEPDETFEFEITAVSGGSAATIGTNDTFSLTITDDDVAAFVRINEVDPGQIGDDTAEFVELSDGGVGSTSLNGLSLVFIDGADAANPTVYAAYDLSAYATDAGGLFVAGNTGVNGAALTFPANTLQGGADAVALYAGDPPANGTTATTAGLVDVVVYGAGVERSAELLEALGQTVQYEEFYRNGLVNSSLARLNVPAFGSTELFYALEPTPGVLNPATLAVDRTADVFNPTTADGDGAGWRHLSSPVLLPTASTPPFRSPAVGDYAAVNLVQGVPAGSAFPAQYPDAGDNMLTRYLDGSYLPPVNADEVLPPGLGFMWYFYDLDILGRGGTSVSYELGNPAFHLALAGLPLDDLVGATAGYSITVPVSADGFYSLGNPYAYPYYLGDASVSSGLLSTNFYVWQASTGSFALLFSDTDAPADGDVLPVFNGVFAEVTGPSTPSVVFATSSDYVAPTAYETDVLIDRPASASSAAATSAAEGRLTLRLDGTIGATPVADYAAVIRVRTDALVGWDQHDASKLIPPAATFALLAPVGERDGAPYRQGVRSLPYELGWPFQVPVAFRATGAGVFTVTPDGVASLPAAWSVTLTDHVAGTTADLRAGGYTFAAEAGDWAERFTLTLSAVTTGGETAAPVFALSDAVPNPASSRASLSLTTAVTEHVRAEVYDALGRRVATVYDGQVSAGAATALVVETGVLAPGAYVVRVAGETFSEARRLTVVR